MSRSNSLNQVLSLEDSLDEDNREVLAAAGPRRNPDSPIQTRSARTDIESNAYGPNSLLEVGDESIPRHGSWSAGDSGASTGSHGVTMSRKKRLDPSDPSTWTSPHASPVEVRPRAASEAERPTTPTIHVQQSVQSQEYVGQKRDPPLPSAPAPVSAPTRAHAHGHRKSSGALAAALSGDLHKIQLRHPNERKSSKSSTGSQSPKPPEHRASSPKASIPSAATLLPAANPASNTRRWSEQSVTTDGSGERIGRIERDPNDEDEEAIDGSDEDMERSSSEDEPSPQASRGRQGQHLTEPESPETPKRTQTPTSPVPAIVMSQPDSNHVRAVDEFEQHAKIEHSGALSESRGEVHPPSNFDARSRSPARSTMGDDEAEMRKAKGLPLRVSPIDDKIAERHVKMIIRGDWDLFQNHEEISQEYRHEPRLYLACSDLSNEASYVLEWTIGTLLKDGDTLLIISAIGDENASKQKDVEEPSLEIKLESKRAAEEATRTMDTLTRSTSYQSETPDIKNIKTGTSVASLSENRSLSRAGRTTSGKQDERIRAVEKLENDFLRYVRKTSLQVRCMIEVIHCRSPRHLILNAIDELEPTLVVVGTRGQGTVKNVMMGSFSNYLVTKSSVPVMVARKRLKKARHAKVSSQQIRMTNNLNPFTMSGKRKSLTQARID